MRAYAAFLRAAAAHVRFLRGRGRLLDEESTADLAVLETEYERIHHHLQYPNRPAIFPGLVSRLREERRRRIREIGLHTVAR